MKTSNHELRRHLDALRQVTTVLNYPESLAHEVREGWSELQFLLRGLQHYFSQLRIPPELNNEQAGLESLSRMLSNIMASWLKLEHPPVKHEISRFTGWAFELEIHLERQLELEVAHEERERLSQKEAG